jgi:hypothetical protein
MKRTSSDLDYGPARRVWLRGWILMTAGRQLPVDPTTLDQVTAVVGKPFGIDQLLELVERLLGG